MRNIIPFFCLLPLLAGCIIETKTTIERKPFVRKEVAPIIETQVAEFKDSSRIISITGGKAGEEDIYVIAVKDGAGNAKKLITDRNYDKIKNAHNDEWLNLPIPEEHKQPK